MPARVAWRWAAVQPAVEKLTGTDGKNVHIEWRWSAGQPDRLKQEASEIVLRRPDVIVAVGTPGLHAVHKTALSTPIVFVIVNDPVGQGFVANLARPGGNITGFTFFEFSTLGKSMQVLRDLAPQVTRAVLMFNPEITPYYRKYLASVEAAPHSVPLRVISAEIRSPADIDQFFSMSGIEPRNPLYGETSLGEFDRFYDGTGEPCSVKHDHASGRVGASLTRPRAASIAGAVLERASVP
jgi:putative ABC transport system substrate-binding protein